MPASRPRNPRVSRSGPFTARDRCLPENTQGGLHHMTVRTRGWMAPALHREIEGLFDSVLGSRDAAAFAWAPRIETFTKDDTVHVRLDVPGVDPKDIEVTLDDEVLTIRGERKAGHDDTTYREVRYGRFERLVRVP